uniref:Coiled-coil domain-containing protein 74A-like n=1 Tax=Crocodylus porosus TaxID=8502 RepID=A0A7M4E168_CROPO
MHAVTKPPTTLKKSSTLYTAATVASRYSLKNRQQVEQPKKQESSTEEQVLKVVQTEPDLPDSKVEKTIEQWYQHFLPASSSNPYLVNVLPSYIQKPPTLEECEIVIRQLWSINHMQAQELMYLKSYLQDILRNKRIPEDYLCFKPLFVTFLYPSISSLIVAPLPPAERAVLPALKQTLGNRFAERQKKTQAIQKNRLHRTLL